AEARLALAQLALGLGARHEMADLQADRDPGLEQPFVGLLRIAVEELERAENLVAQPYRQGEGRAQPRLGRLPAAQEAPLGSDVDDPHRLALAQHAADQAGVPRVECGLAARGEERRDGRIALAPGLLAPEPERLGVQAPARAAGPAERLAECGEH